MSHDDLMREIAKISDVLAAVNRHMRAEAEMNAALHMSNEVRPAPLASAVATAADSAYRLWENLDAGVRVDG